MATTSNTYTGNGSNKLFSITFPYLETSDINVYLNGTLQTITTQYFFANATTVEFVTAPANGATILLERSTDDTALQATFFPGSSVKAADLNDNFDQVLYLAQETSNLANSTVSTAATALTTANSANATANGIAGTANTALANANTAVTTANTAVSTANTASSNATTALSNSNTAITTANSATTTANNAVTTANSATTTANAATTTANNAVTTANSAINAVSSVVAFPLVAAVANIPSSPTNGQGVQVTNSTGIQSFTPLAGLPVGFTGDAGLNVKLQYTTTGSTWNWIGYAPNDSDSRYLKLTGGTLTGSVALSSGGTSTTAAVDNNSTNIATTAYVVGQAAGTAPVMAGTAAVGTSLRYARQDHRHPTDTTRAPLASPTFTGTVTIPGGASISGFATLASPTFTGTVTIPGGASISGFATLASPTFTGTPAAPTATAGTNTTQIATTAFATALTATALPLSGGTMTGVITYAAAQPRLVSGTSIASTSGTSIDFTGLPSWVKRVTVMFNGVSTNGTSNIICRVGTSGGVVATGYDSMCGQINSTNPTSISRRTDAFVLCGSPAASLSQGSYAITNLTGNTWTAMGVFSETTTIVSMCSGAVVLSATLDRIRITTVNGTDTFDAGSINILYEG